MNANCCDNEYHVWLHFLHINDSVVKCHSILSVVTLSRLWFQLNLLQQVPGPKQIASLFSLREHLRYLEKPKVRLHI